MCDCKKMTNIRYATVEKAHLAYLLFGEHHTHVLCSVVDDKKGEKI